MRITIIGCGYVGLVTGACLAEVGHTVTCADNDRQKIDILLRGGVPIYEQHLSDIVARNREAGRLSFTADLALAVRAGDIVFICVGTPPLESGDVDLTAMNRVAQLIATEAQAPKLVVEKSTVPVQTGQQLKRALAGYTRDRELQFRVASNPEFLREGTAVLDFLHPSRIVIGVEDTGAEEQLRELYRPLLDGRYRCPVHAGDCPPGDPPAFLVTTINSAELIKHASNSFLALKISYANLLADYCDRLHADVEQVTHAVGLDPRIGAGFLHAGLGFGGFCLPKDIQAFIHMGKRAGVDVTLLQAAEGINRQRIAQVIELLREALWMLQGKRIGVLGLSFKANTDDVRFSPALALVQRLLNEGAEVRGYDPQAMARARAIVTGFDTAPDPYALGEGSEALVIATEWPQFKSLDWGRMSKLMTRPLLLDARNLLDPAAMQALGFEYYSIGRPHRRTQPATAP